MILTNSEINSLCQYAYARASTEDNYIQILFYMMMNYGLRSEEVTEKNLWLYNSSTDIKLQTAKGGGVRTFTENDIPNNFIEWMNYTSDSRALASKRNLRRYFDSVNPYSSLTVGEKEIAVHIFRHNKAKLLHDSGMTDSEVQNYFKLSSLTVTKEYIYSEVNGE